MHIYSPSASYQNHHFAVPSFRVLRRILEYIDCGVDGMGSICFVTLIRNLVHCSLEKHCQVRAIQMQVRIQVAFKSSF